MSLPQLSLPQRRSLVTRIVVNRAFGPVRGIPTFDDVRSATLDLMNREADATLSTANNERLDKYTVQVANFARVTVPAMPSVTLCQEGQDALHQLHQRASAIDCTLCAESASGHICNGTAADDITVAESGHCLDEVWRICRAAVKTAEAYYNEYSVVFRELSDPPKVSLATAYYVPGASGRDKPHSIPVPVYIGAKTRFMDAFEPSTAEITLEFAIDGIDLNSLEALPYIVLHETVCHVFQGLASPSGARVAPPEFDWLGEGWIDGTVEAIFRDFQANRGPAASYRGVIGSDGQVVAGLEMHYARTNAARRVMSPITPYVMRSRAVGRHLETILRERLGDSDGGSAFLQLTYDLNLLLASPRSRARLVNKLARSLSPKDGGHSSVIGAINAFALSNDSRRFLYDLSQW
jgi:hypothetical protein